VKWLKRQYASEIVHQNQLDGSPWNLRVMVSFGMASLTKRQSFPRKRESSPPTADFQRFAGWIPAFAGMTVTSTAHVSQMTPVPTSAKRKRELQGFFGPKNGPQNDRHLKKTAGSVELRNSGSESPQVGAQSSRQAFFWNPFQNHVLNAVLFAKGALFRHIAIFVHRVYVRLYDGNLRFGIHPATS